MVCDLSNISVMSFQSDRWIKTGVLVTNFPLDNCNSYGYSENLLSIIVQLLFTTTKQFIGSGRYDID
jgi:hypothetical protein